MVLFGIQFDDHELVRQSVADMILENSEKPVVKILFNVQAYCIGTDILIIHKEFIAEKTMNWMFAIILLISIIPWFVWQISVPFFIVAGLICVWSLLSSKIFNFWMFKIMIRKRFDYKPTLRLL